MGITDHLWQAPRPRGHSQYALSTMLLLLTAACIATTLGVWRATADRDWWILPHGPLDFVVRGIVYDAVVLAFAVATCKHLQRKHRELRLIFVALPGVLLWLTIVVMEIDGLDAAALLWCLDERLLWPLLGLHLLCLGAIMATLCWRTDDYVLRNLSLIVNASCARDLLAVGRLPQRSSEERYT